MAQARHARRTKIVASLGPASSDPATIRALFDAGDDHTRRYAILRELERESAHPAAVLMDLQGPKIRVGAFEGGRVMLREGAAFRLDLDPAPGDGMRATMPHPELFAALAPGADVLLDDGRIRLLVKRHGPDFAETVVVSGGVLFDRKGVQLPLSALSLKDRQDLAFALDPGVDWIGLSFVQRPEDVPEDVTEALADRQPGRHRVQNRQAGRHPAVAGDRRGIGRGHGRARRPRRGVSARRCARPAEAHRAAVPGDGPPGNHRDADVGEHDLHPRAHTGGGVGRGNRDVRRRGRCDTVG